MTANCMSGTNYVTEMLLLASRGGEMMMTSHSFLFFILNTVVEHTNSFHLLKDVR
jgi:hypothetical protein